MLKEHGFVHLYSNQCEHYDSPLNLFRIELLLGKMAQENDETMLIEIMAFTKVERTAAGQCYNEYQMWLPDPLTVQKLQDFCRKWLSQAQEAGSSSSPSAANGCRKRKRQAHQVASESNHA